MTPTKPCRTVALAGNPNVGKSTVFNGLTGLRQHTGNWPGKTVETATGQFQTPGGCYILVDLPGTYSLLAHSAEEEVARDYLCSNAADAVIVVCDATCLERNLNLVLQIIELAPDRPMLVCLNLMDEAARKGIALSPEALSRALGLPVVGLSARRPRELARLTAALDALIAPPAAPTLPRYPDDIEAAIAAEMAAASCPRRQALLTLSHDPAYTDRIAAALIAQAESIAHAACAAPGCGYAPADRRIDRIVTGRFTAYPVMLVLLAGILWLTVQGANYPSAWLSSLFGVLEELLSRGLSAIGAPAWLRSLLGEGILRTLGQVVSVMLPPMAIFFPLFTLLEDAGFLPRIAYNLDRPFCACRACGKQALTMCMGFGCNAVGVSGCRIIDSPRERLLAQLTNSLVPCNGRFPTLIALITLFLVGGGGRWDGLAAALWLTAFILLGILATFGMTRLLSASLLRGMPSAFTLELPPYRPPKLGQVLVRSVLDRTVFVLGRAAAVAAPAGLLIWLLANCSFGGTSLLGHLAAFLDPAARLIGLDGVILLGFILGTPANEIVLPIIVMTYAAEGQMDGALSLDALRPLLTAHGWDAGRALCVMLFSLFHWPCATTLLTVRRETGSWRQTALAAALPTALGVAVCAAVNLLFHLMV